MRVSAWRGRAASVRPAARRSHAGPASHLSLPGRNVPPLPWPHRSPLSRGSRRGTVLVIVLVTLMFATAALLLFIDRASTDLLVESREADARRLQTEAYSALETTLAVLQEFHLAGNGLHSPHEGWEDPLEWAGYEPPDGMAITVEFKDESGKLSLPRIDAATLTNLFTSWEVPQADSDRLVDALLGWMQADYRPRSSSSPQARDYERAELPFRPPERPMRSFSELRAIEYVREQFFDETGRLTDLGRRFIDSVSLYDFTRPNINAAPEGVLAAVGGYDPYQQKQLDDYRQGSGAYVRSQRFFRSANEVATVLGQQGVAAGFGADIVALRVTVTVRDGRSAYRLEAVVAPPNGARLVSAPGIPAPVGERASNQAPETRQPQAPGAADKESARTSTSLQYPFTLLEIRENAAIASAPLEAPQHLRSPNL